MNKNTQIEFEFGQPAIITLDLDPSKAPITKSGKSWSYFTKDNCIFWANKVLHDALQLFSKGDTISITKKFENGELKWEVESSDSVPKDNKHLATGMGLAAPSLAVETHKNTIEILKILKNEKGLTEDEGDPTINKEVGF